MFICLDCGAGFTAGEMDKRIERVSDEFGFHYEEWGVCPECGSEDFEEATECDECGKEWPQTKINMNGDCPDCVRRKLWVI